MPLIAVLERLGEPLPEPLALKVLETVRSYRDDWDRARALSVLAAHLPEPLMPAVLEIAGGIQDDGFDRAQLLIRLGGLLPRDLLPKVLNLAYETEDESDRLVALIGLLPHFPDILPSLILASRGAASPTTRSYALAKLAMYAPGITAEALSAILENPYEVERASMLEAVLVHLTAAMLPEISAIIDGIESAMLRERILLKMRDRFGSEWEYRAGEQSAIAQE